MNTYNKNYNRTSTATVEAAVEKSFTAATTAISKMFSIKFRGTVIISVIIFPKFLASASLKN